MKGLSIHDVHVVVNIPSNVNSRHSDDLGSELQDIKPRIQVYCGVRPAENITSLVGISYSYVRIMRCRLSDDVSKKRIRFNNVDGSKLKGIYFFNDVYVIKDLQRLCREIGHARMTLQRN